MHPVFRSALYAVLFTISVPAAIEAHEGHVHSGDAPPPVTEVASASPRVEATSSALEMVALPQNGAIQIFLDRFETNEPVSGASIIADTAAGSLEAKPFEEGTYLLQGDWTASAGTHDVILTVTVGDLVEIFPVQIAVPTAAVPEAAPTAGLTLASIGGQLPDKRSWLFVLLGAITGVAIMMLRSRPRAVIAVLLAGSMLFFVSYASAHEGHVHADDKPAADAKAPSPAGRARDIAQRLPDGTLFVPKPTQRILAIRTLIAEPRAHSRSIELPGRVIPDPNASGYVQASVGGRLSPPAQGFPRLGSVVKAGDILAYVTPPVGSKDASDMRQSLGELDQQISIVERRVGRFEKLAASGAVTQTQLTEARLELEGLKERRVALQTARVEQEPLVAPVDGIIADASAVAGQMAEPSAIVFHIVNPDRLWVEALSFEAVSETQSASASFADGQSIELAYQGAGLADRNQSVPVHFEIRGEPPRARIGQFVTVLASTDTITEGVALPRTSVVRAANGQDFVFEHTSPERFVAREVRVEPLDGQNVLVAAGVTKSSRIVTQGAELLNQVR